MTKYKEAEEIKELLIKAGFKFSEDPNFQRDTIVNIKRSNSDLKKKLGKIIDNI